MSRLLKTVDFTRNTCPVCLKVFNRKDHVQRHYVELHLRKVSFECGKCKKKFKRKYLMGHHEKNCLGLAMHQCWSCKNVFRTREYLMYHMKRVHNVNDVDSVKAERKDEVLKKDEAVKKKK